MLVKDILNSENVREMRYDIDIINKTTSVFSHYSSLEIDKCIESYGQRELKMVTVDPTVKIIKIYIVKR